MLELGYDQYVTQDGDWGYMITRALGGMYPDSCKASHINFLRPKQPVYGKNPFLALQHSIQPYTEQEKNGLKRTAWFAKEGSGKCALASIGPTTHSDAGYNILQSTKPQTLAYALQDSPVALLAWIYEKLHDWTDNYPWTDEEILTWISIYQFSRAGPGAAQRIYYEVAHTKQSTHSLGIPGRPFTREDTAGYIKSVKLGVTFNPKELVVLPKVWARTMGDLVYEAENSAGG
jgi:hypothetical protein